MPSARETIDELREQIRRHDHLYYVEGRPTLSDREYDRHFDRLVALEAEHPECVTPDSPTQRVGGEPLEGFEHVTHAVAMLSIDNTYNEAELREFDARVAKGLGDEAYEYLVDPKVDGVSASLRYEDGLLVLGATRGDGRTGDVITPNVKTIGAVPLRLRGKRWPTVLEVRGEVYWPREPFDAHNSKREKEGLEPFANPRNATSGALKSLDSRAIAGRGLSFVAHGLGEIVGGAFETAAGMFEAFKGWGIPVSPECKVCKDIDGVIQFIGPWDAKRRELGYETDGLVIKVNRLDQREALGATSRFPRWCIAYKYAAEQAEACLKDVSFQVGRTGAITPVAHFEAVHLGGTNVSNASLHNFDEIERLGIHRNDVIIIEKAGEIIPQVVRVLKKAPAPKREPIDPPTHCPECGCELKWDETKPRHVAYRCTHRDCELYLLRRQRIKPPHTCRMATGRGCDEPVEVVDHMVDLRCVNPECRARLKELLTYFGGRDQMDIQHLGPAAVDQLVDKGLVQHLADLYALKLSDLEGLKGFKDKSASNLHSALLDSKSRGLARVLAGLGIPKVGKRIAETLANEFGDIECLLDADEAEIRKRLQSTTATVESVSRRTATKTEKTMASAICSFLNSDDGKKRLACLRTGIRFSEKMQLLRIPGFQKKSVLASRIPALENAFEGDVTSLASASPEQVERALATGPSELLAASLARFFNRPDWREAVATLPDGFSLGEQISRLRIPGLPRSAPLEKRIPLLEKRFGDLASLAGSTMEEIEQAVTATPEKLMATALYKFFRAKRGREALRALPRDLAFAERIARLKIPGFTGPTVFEKRLPLLEEFFGDVGSLTDATDEQIEEALKGKSLIAESVYEFFHKRNGSQIVRALRDVGVKMTQGPRAPLQDRPLVGKTVVVTGTVQGFTRGEIEGRIKELGGKPSGSVSNKTDFLVAGDKPGSKLAKAKSLGVTILDEKEFLRLSGRG